MKRVALGCALLAIVMASSASAETRTYFGFQIGIGNAPPPPAIVYDAPPPCYYEPQTRVYVVRDGWGGDDAFRYGRFWYVNRGDYWYRARFYRGPFVVVDVRSVPRSIFYVPRARWHRYPPSLVRWNEGHGHGRGYARGHDAGRADARRDHRDHND
jgi:hypothetical protein